MKISLLRSSFLLLSRTPLLSRKIQGHPHRSYASQTCTLPDNVAVGSEPSAIATALTFCENKRSYVLGGQIHGRMIKLGLTHDVFSLNNLIKMYRKCGMFVYGFKVFDEMPHRNVVSWTLIISGANANGDFEFGLEIFLYMMRNGVSPNEFTLGSVMKACADAGAYELGFSVHCLAWKISMDQNLFVMGSTLNMYARHGDIESAELIFSSMDIIDVGCWNSMIGAYARSDFGFEALNIVSAMHRSGLVMDHFTFINALQGCSVIENLEYGKQLHGLIIHSELKHNLSVMNALMDMYSVSGCKISALKLFSCMPIKDIVTWNTAIGLSNQDMNANRIVELFYELMLVGIKPNHITFSVLFQQCGELLDVKLGLQFCCLALHFGYLSELIIRRSLIKMFSQFGWMDMAYLVFDTVFFKPVIVWNELISGYNLNSCYTEALQTFLKLWSLGVEADEYTFSITLEACCKLESHLISRLVHCAALKNSFGSHGYVSTALVRCYVNFGLLEDSFQFVNGQESKDLAFWATLISELVHRHDTHEALRFLKTLIKSGVKPDEYIFGTVINGCSYNGAYKQTKSIHSLVKKMGFDEHVFVASAIIDAYAKSGDILSAQLAFEQSSDSNDIIVFNSMISGYAHHGLAREAVDIFEKMDMANLQPSQATFVGIISACSHIGLVDEGHSFFEKMKRDYNMAPSLETFGCVVDMLSRNGRLQDAQQIIESMPFPPWHELMRSFLNGCRIHGNREMGEWAASKLFQLAPKNEAAFVMLSNVYAEGGSWEDAAKMRGFMIDRGILKGTAYSWMEIW